MALNERQEALYLDRFDVFRVQEYDEEGDPLGYVAVPGEQDVPCKLYTTDQYDTRTSPAGMSNKDNLQTADFLHEESNRDTRSADVVRVRQLGSPETLWYTVKGSPQNRPSQGGRDTNYQKVYLATTPLPKIFDPEIGIYTDVYRATY